MNSETKPNLTETDSNNRSLMMEISAELGSLAVSFARTGNSEIAITLNAIAVDIETSSKRMSDAVSDDLHEQYIRSQEASGNMLTAVLAGITTATGE